MSYRVEIEREDDGRWIAEVVELPVVLAYGLSADDALANVQIGWSTKRVRGSHRVLERTSWPEFV